VVPHIFLTNSDVLFQVSFNSPNDIVYTNKTKNSKLDCGYKGLAALGLRNKQRSLMESNLVNKRGKEGIIPSDIAKYISNIYGLGIDKVELRYCNSNAHHIETVMRSKLRLNHATLFLIELENIKNKSITFLHYMIAYNDQNTIYYYNPQTNLINAPSYNYISPDLQDLVTDIYPSYKISMFLYYDILEHGIPKPVNISKLNDFLLFVG